MPHIVSPSQADLSLKKKQYSLYCYFALLEVDMMIDLNDIKGTQEGLQQVSIYFENIKKWRFHVMLTDVRMMKYCTCTS